MRCRLHELAKAAGLSLLRGSPSASNLFQNTSHSIRCRGSSALFSIHLSIVTRFNVSNGERGFGFSAMARTNVMVSSLADIGTVFTSSMYAREM